MALFACKLYTMGFKENLKSELAYSGMLVKELASRSGVPQHSINNYLNVRGQIPSIEAGVKIAQALGVSAEYLVTGKEGELTKEAEKTKEIRLITQFIEQLDDEKRKFIINFIKWFKLRKSRTPSAPSP